MLGTREKILRATFLLMIKKGFDKILVSDIQNALGISRGLLYRYFNGKAELVFSACREYFYDRYFDRGLDYANMTMREFLDRAEIAVSRMTNIDGVEVEIMKYNTLYSSILQVNPRFALVAQAEFDKARLVIRNAIRRGEIKKLPENFVGATILAIFGRTSYITDTPSNAYICRRVIEDANRFYDLIKACGAAKPKRAAQKPARPLKIKTKNKKGEHKK